MPKNLKLAHKLRLIVVCGAASTVAVGEIGLTRVNTQKAGLHDLYDDTTMLERFAS